MSAPASRAALVSAFATGTLFSLGLSLSGMTQPQKVIAFLDFTGAWDPSLALVMGGALAVFAPVYFLFVRKRERPVLEPAFEPTATQGIDGRLVVGAALFGVGWGVSGFCPGPALASITAGSASALVFVPTLVLGTFAGRFFLAEKGPSGLSRTASCS